MSNYGLVDAHIHLTDYEPGTDTATIIEKASDSGVSHLVCNGTSERDWQKVLELASSNKSVIPFVGLHPWFVKDKSNDWFPALDEILSQHHCGVGEIGLDRLAEPFFAYDQEEAFRAQLDMAVSYDRPVTIHCVRAWGWLLDILRNKTNLPTKMLIHAYGGSPDMIKQFADLGAYFSFSGNVLDERRHRARKSLLAAPLDRLLIETDAPNMLPPEAYCTDTIKVSNGRTHNHPANLPTILNGIAELLAIPNAKLREQLWKNAQSFFGRMLNQI